MDQTSSATTGAVAMTSAMIGTVVPWVCSLLHVAAPPDPVPTVIGAGLLAAIHALSNLVRSRNSHPTAPEQ